ncbi:Hsp20/alpha crystallin family protein [Sediminibacillus massiliensis]|uniref:Hsp20/alpha crystallin family protein n=1 Tax=Sediminibacillus massiliensis TaxID=1926277 RepID=UPI0009887110|nr:Hsp20/alpha crystallin family protein [Sediminibacillus massiliensis]
MEDQHNKRDRDRELRRPAMNNPMQQMEEFFMNASQNRLLDSIDSFLQRPFFGKGSIPIDLFETETEWVIQADLPGVKKEQINIEAFNEQVKIAITDTREKEEINEKGNYYRRERRMQGAERIVQLPYTVRKQKIKAKYRDGILEIRGPKEERKYNQIEID